LYGSVTTADVVEKLNEELGTEVERRQIVGGPLRQLGDHKVTVRLSRDYQPQITVTIEQFEEEVPEEEQLEAVEAAEGAAEEAEEATVDEAEDEEAAESEEGIDEAEPMAADEATEND
ncbi:MAG: hypothetical protein JSW55_14640, partial [Chloroflexota bacterium]